MEKIKIKAKYNTDLKPQYQTSHSAGMDLLADIKNDIVLCSGDRVLVPTGLYLQLPDSYEAQVRPRSGLAIKHGISLVNSPGTIDADYRGEISVIIINHGSEDFIIRRGERIAQLVICPVLQAELEYSETLSSTERGTGGFGSTGK
jgi:dUTP pyrophosphatase